MNMLKQPLPDWLDNTDSQRWLPGMYIVVLPHGVIVRDADRGASCFVPAPTPAQADWARLLRQMEEARDTLTNLAQASNDHLADMAAMLDGDDDIPDIDALREATEAANRVLCIGPEATTTS